MLEIENKINKIKYKNAGLITLGILQTIMLGSLYAQIKPHPPAVIAPFAIAPFLGVSISMVVIAIYLQGSKATSYFATASCFTALISFGPQKYLDPAFPFIWPAVILAQAAIIVIIINVINGMSKGNQDV